MNIRHVLIKAIQDQQTTTDNYKDIAVGSIFVTICTTVGGVLRGLEPPYKYVGGFIVWLGIGGTNIVFSKPLEVN